MWGLVEDTLDSTLDALGDNWSGGVFGRREDLSL